MSIHVSIIKELEEAPFKADITEPLAIFKVGVLADTDVEVIHAQFKEVFISKRSLKHIIDQRKGSDIILKIRNIIESPTKIIDNSLKRGNSFLFAKMNGKAQGVVIELTKTPDGNRVVSAFPISKGYYRRLIDISGRAAVPPFATPSNREISS